ncbi:MAG TPA: hypothetical protein VK988_20930 [Acidimicrobiales bacterium]|nr:hypothetical protein [Acidimicrobiales bacterium]
MSPVHHCPSCGLAFRNKTELEYHWSEEHDPALHPPPPPPPPDTEDDAP